jgi:hypothetical protein
MNFFLLYGLINLMNMFYLKLKYNLHVTSIELFEFMGLCILTI